MKKRLLLQVAESRVLTGLGVLLLPVTSPDYLTSLDLHTSLSIWLIYPDKQENSAIASVEEIARTGAPPMRVLLLTQEGAAVVPAGTEVWLK